MQTLIPKPALAFAARDATTVSEALRHDDRTVWLGVATPLLHQLREPLARAYRAGLVRPAYVLSGEPSQLTSEELIADLRLNERVMHEVLGVPNPMRRVLVLDAAPSAEQIRVLEMYGIDAVVLPNAPERPCRIGERLMWLGPDDLDDELTPPWLPLHGEAES